VTRALIVEDDPKIRAHLEFRLRRDGFRTVAVDDGEPALELLTGGSEPLPDLLLLDIRLPRMSGIELVRRLAAEGRLPPTVVISGEASLAEAVEAIRLGVHDFVEKPFSDERLQRSVANALESSSLRREVARLRAEAGGEQELLGESAAMVALRREIDRAADTEARILIRGESGTGKELVADRLHRSSRRAGGPFIKLNCAALPDHLVEDELFGHVKGAFTDARSDKAGLFEAAHGGTLFLDEIGDMEYPLQARLLRVLEDGRVRRVGETRERGFDVRVIAATHADLERAIAEGRFREDLYFRLAHLPIDVPPLRRREGDVHRLAEHFLGRFSGRHRVPPRTLEREVWSRLESYAWPGNVRELASLCERLVVFGTDPVTVEQLPARYRGETGAGSDRASEELLADRLPTLPLGDFKAQAEREYIERILERTGWNVTAAARLLGVHRTHLHHRLAALGSRRPD
jgi:DNA-binding NtrC family response regulator